MSGTLAAYDPNALWGLQVVEITLMQWDYRAGFIEKVGGNCHGMSIIDCAIENLFESALPDDGPARVVLTNPSGDRLICEDEEDAGVGWLKDMVVSARIVAREAGE